MFNLYVKLMEECGEVVRACSKVLKRGRSGVEEQQLAEEIGDVLAVLDLMRRKGAIDMRIVERKQQATYEKYIHLEL